MYCYTLHVFSLKFFFFNSKVFLVLFGSEKYDSIYIRSRYLISLKSGITYISSYYYAKIKVNFFDSLPIVKILTLHNVKIPIKSVLNKNKKLSSSTIIFFKKIFVYQLAEKQPQFFLIVQ